MREIWLKPNRRAILFGAIAPVAIAMLGAWLVVGPVTNGGRTWQWAGFVLMVVGFLVAAMLLRQLVRPRIAYGGGHVKFYLRNGSPIDVPVEVVEAFFLGQGSAGLPVGVRRQDQAVNLVARLSQRHAEWARQEVKPALGNWCEGYVTIRGTWCEPLTGEVIRRLNRRLKEVRTGIAEEIATR